MSKRKVVAIIPTRLDSSRLPGKALLPLGISGKPVLQHIIERIRQATTVDSIMLAVASNLKNMPIIDLGKKMRCMCFRGSDDDVMDRMTKATQVYKSKHNLIIVDISHDCPMVDPQMIDYTVNMLFKENLDYCTNVLTRSWPDGFDIQVYKEEALHKANKFITNPNHRVHSGWNIVQYKENFPEIRIGGWQAPPSCDYPEWGLTLDTEEDYQLLQIIFNYFERHSQYSFSAVQVIEYLKQNPRLLDINYDIRRKTFDEG